MDVQSRGDMPSVFAGCRGGVTVGHVDGSMQSIMEGGVLVIGIEHVAMLVRHVAIHANIFAQIFRQLISQGPVKQEEVS
jgi:hypothetical protein